MFDDVELFCLFMGYTRSGHSLVGTVLDAHPEAVIAHEGKIFASEEGKSITGGLRAVDRRRLFTYLVDRSARQAREGHRGYRRDQSAPTNLIPGGSHGTYTTLRVLGTKRGQEPPIAWDRNPLVFDQLEELAQAKVRMIHVYRNPWDNIASMGRFHGDRAIVKYFRRAEIIKRFREQEVLPMYDLALEDLVADPAKEVRGLLEFLDLPVTDEFLAACADNIDRRVSASRKEREWTRQDVEMVVRRMAMIPWLERYPRRPWH
ncbi:sulfotransferase [Capillimicrobium parvum]|uniref:Sulfotransferase n=1 Tax=Capillimicrobium parvum TaxID=2884022 RepID=A0A9E6Y3B7_9ACTN|nr:sulfotransferase [Capillimicrobium parvum]UGS38813.1 hypothetical protein DSM104329_05243 [Capillimicrobium parvum]